MKPSILRRQTVMSMTCGVLAALAYGNGSRPSGDIIRSETILAATPAILEPEAAVDASGGQSLVFLPNDGRFERFIRFAARGTAYEVGLRPDGARLVLDARPGDPLQRVEFDLRFVGGRLARTVEGLEELPRLESNGVAKAIPEADRKFGRVRANGIYEGIDVEYYGRDSQLEYDFIVAPRADPTNIAFVFDGVDAVSIDAAGDLVLRAGARTIRQRRPQAFQQTRTGRRRVEANYLVLDSKRVVIALGDYDRNRQLVIDPTIDCAGNGAGRGRAIQNW